MKLYGYIRDCSGNLLILHCFHYKRTVNFSHFYSDPLRFANAVYATANPSVCPLHAGIGTKRGTAEGCGLHRRV